MVNIELGAIGLNVKIRNVDNFNLVHEKSVVKYLFLTLTNYQ